MEGNPGNARLTQASIRQALPLRVVEVVSIVGVFAVPVLVTIATLIRGAGPPGPTPAASAGASARAWIIGWICVALPNAFLYRKSRERKVVVKRWQRLRTLRSRRSRRTVRRAAAQIALQYDIADDVKIYARTLVKRHSCPVEIELSTDNHSWRLRREGPSWVEERQNRSIT